MYAVEWNLGRPTLRRRPLSQLHNGTGPGMGDDTGCGPDRSPSPADLRPLSHRSPTNQRRAPFTARGGRGTPPADTVTEDGASATGRTETLGIT